MPVVDIQRLKGQLVLDPTNLTTGPDYGGVNMGYCKSIIWRPGGYVVHTDAKEHAQPAEFFQINGPTVVACQLRELTPGCVNAFFAPPATGTRLTGRKLLFMPDAPGGYGLVIYNAFFMHDATAGIRFSALKETTVPLVFKGIADANGRIYQFAKKAGLVL